MHTGQQALAGEREGKKTKLSSSTINHITQQSPDKDTTENRPPNPQLEELKQA